MYKSYLMLLLAIVCLLSFSNLKAQTYTSGDITAVAAPSFSHDSTVCYSRCVLIYDLTISGSFIGDTFAMIDTVDGSLVFSHVNTSGANPWVFSDTISTTFTPDSWVSGGYVHFSMNALKMISGSDTIHYTNNSFAYPVTNPCIYSSISGMVYADNNSDCIFNSGDIALDAVLVNCASHLSGAFPILNDYAVSGSTGNFNLGILQSWMTSCDVSMDPYYNFIFPPTSCSPITYNFTSLPQANVDFPVQATTNVDVECWAGSSSIVRPNRPFFMQPYVSNIGYNAVSGQLIFVKDGRVGYNASLSSNPAMTVIGDTLIWYYAGLTCVAGGAAPGGAYWNNFMSQIHLTPDSTVNIGDTLCFRVYTGVPTTDINPANNDYTICLPVVNSYDPNIKEVSPKGVGPQGYIAAGTSELTYTIHFQNTGTAPAIDISVIDTLDGDVDASSLKIMGTSHTMLPEWFAPNVVKFKYSNINLADSFSNEPASHGYVRFTVKLHNGLPLGTQIKNKGYIYFDANPAVVTNETLNTIVANTAVDAPVVTNNVKVYPNPATDNIFVEQLQGGKLSILSMNGSVIIDQDITNNKTEIDISRLPAGMYILRTVSNENTKTTKFVKQ